MLAPARCVLRVRECPTRISRVSRAAPGPQPGQGGRVQLSTGHSSRCPDALCGTSLNPSLHPTGFPGVQPHRGDCQSPQPAEAVGRQAEHGHGGLAACPHRACASGGSRSRHRTRRPSTQIPQLPWDEDKGLKRRPPPPRWPGRRMSSDISQSSVQKYTGAGFTLRLHPPHTGVNPAGGLQSPPHSPHHNWEVMTSKILIPGLRIPPSPVAIRSKPLGSFWPPG